MSISTSDTIERSRLRSRSEPRRRSRGSGDAHWQRRRPTPGDGGSGPKTLEDLIVTTIDRIAAAGTARCPVCSGPALAAAGCESCGSSLS